jgi:serine/threonine protein phosphatase PrpC
MANDRGGFAVAAGDLKLTVAAGTQIGNRYRANFDVLALAPGVPMVVVADGMGDGEGSAVAGRTAVDTFVAEVRAYEDDLNQRTLRAAVAEAQRRVRAAGERLAELTGCTLTALLAGDGVGAGWIVQIGDSRAYRLRGRLLELLTVDHTAAWLGAIYGWYPGDSAAAAAARYHLHRYIGHPDQPEPDVLGISLHPGDVYCVCTDGLAEDVPYQRMTQVLGGGGDPRAMVDRLLADALAAGGRDNATVVVIRVDGAAGWTPA